MAAPRYTKPPVRILLVEDSPDDAELIGFALRVAPFAVSIDRVDTAQQFRSSLDMARPDIVLCDYHLPRFSMRKALQIVREDYALDLPFIVVSRLIGEDAAVEAMLDGADDYLLKGRLGRLPAAISAALERSESRREKARAGAALGGRAVALELNEGIEQSLAALETALNALAGRVTGAEAAQLAQCTEIARELREKLRRFREQS